MIICDIPNTSNVVVIIRVDESVQAPHAIEKSTRVYIRTGSITQPYELAEVDRIEYMLKRRGDSQITTREIINRAEERTESLFVTDTPNITVITRPVFPHRPLIATGKILDFSRRTGFINNPTGARVAGGMVNVTGRRSDLYDYWEYNEYGIAYRRKSLSSGRGDSVSSGEEYLDFSECIGMIGRLIDKARHFYKECAYLGTIEITVQLRHVFDEKLSFHRIPGAPRWVGADTTEQRCIDSEVRISTQRLAHCLEGEKFIDVIDELTSQLLWAFMLMLETWRGERRYHLFYGQSGVGVNCQNQAARDRRIFRITNVNG